MISSTFLGPLAVALTCASSALAFDNIDIPSTVNANTEVEITIQTDIADGRKSFDAQFTNFNLYLATTPPGWGTGPVCLLANGTKMGTTTVKVKIPADVVPESAELEISSMEWNSDPHKDGPSGFEYSNAFYLKGGTGEWGKSELAGQGLGDPDHIPCSAYACARKCNDKYYSQVNKNKDDINSYKSTYECIAACPGTTYPSWESVISQNGGKDGNDDGNDDNSSSSSDSSETTSATPSGTPVAASTSSTGSSVSTTHAASTPTHTTNGASQLSVRAGLILTGLVAAYIIF
ncbi:hypothetical protein BGZ63DRAFT_421304 [Mariannaea sp. PMI_226]|nr:hypothetical protein BGZ63DRAFT_421304 [Mariannaea sp. PMI_226]